MNSRFVGTLLVILVAACLVTGIIVYPNLPAVLLSHWDAAGHPNGTMSALWGTFLPPIVMAFLVVLWAVLPRIDPIAPGFKEFRIVYDLFIFLVIALFAYAYALVLGVNLGWQISIPHFLLPALAILIFALGVILPRLKRNWFIGIRTPWTISDDTVWEKTHRLGGVLFMIAGVCALASAFLSIKSALWLFITSVISAAIVSVVYSYVLFTLPRDGPDRWYTFTYGRRAYYYHITPARWDRLDRHQRTDF